MEIATSTSQETSTRRTRHVTFQGNPTINLGGNGCGELIAKSVAFNGNATFDNNGCSDGTEA